MFQFRIRVVVSEPRLIVAPAKGSNLSLYRGSCAYRSVINRGHNTRVVQVTEQMFIHTHIRDESSVIGWIFTEAAKFNLSVTWRQRLGPTKPLKDFHRRLDPCFGYDWTELSEGLVITFAAANPWLFTSLGNGLSVWGCSVRTQPICWHKIKFWIFDIQSTKAGLGAFSLRKTQPFEGI